jgi:hypothetical protein
MAGILRILNLKVLSMPAIKLAQNTSRTKFSALMVESALCRCGTKKRSTAAAVAQDDWFFSLYTCFYFLPKYFERTGVMPKKSKFFVLGLSIGPNVLPISTLSTVHSTRLHVVSWRRSNPGWNNCTIRYPDCTLPVFQLSTGYSFHFKFFFQNL